MAKLALFAVLTSGALVSSALAQGRGPGPHGMGMMGGGAHGGDMATIHALFADPTIRRTVREIPGGVETVTESSTPEGAANIQLHVAAMHERLENDEPIHMRDPLFAELFKYADRITMKIEKTARGMRVRETSTDPYVTKLIRAHAAVVTKFIENGRREMHVNHAVPAP